jgi:hypothetical protein
MFPGWDPLAPGRGPMFILLGPLPGPLPMQRMFTAGGSHEDNFTIYVLFGIIWGVLSCALDVHVLRCGISQPQKYTYVFVQ